MRIGQGYDVHPLVDGERLILGGIEIPFQKGLKGRSDADVLIHAISDALLGAIGLGDLGQHFPESEPWTDGISSIKILQKVKKMVAQKGYEIQNIDATIVAQFPKLARYIPKMVEKIAATLGKHPDLVNIKATTTEGLGPVGRGEGMEAHAVVCLLRKDG
jgi:2-C-methyl-D-erythritol 2,4-cyclodiphosphate synthase